MRRRKCSTSAINAESDRRDAQSFAAAAEDYSLARQEKRRYRAGMP
jgi:hypothetical protein